MTPGRILFCSPHSLSLRLGASKVYMEAADAFRGIGWETKVIGPEDTGGREGSTEYPPALRNYLRNQGEHFDVVEYEHNRLPYPRFDFPAATLFVARSVL